ncbi:MAG: DUF1460 domain-containing protein [Bacteroidaceae bacterium]|nr:DUF1460 domain-containing protein [Bacteroidaceae bacterium]
MKRILLTGIFLLSVCGLWAENQDSIKVERWLEAAESIPQDSCRTLHFAKLLLGVPYVGGTLDGNEQETLVVSLDKLDCTTFVETVMALTLADKENKRTFGSFKERLTAIRYRGGVLDGYPSRLHYFSDWIRDNERKGFVKECTSETLCCQSQTLRLDFMSTHADSYLPLKKDTSLVAEITSMEQAWKGVEVCYIPKNKLHLSPKELQIVDGDILAITTSIKGLDVVHVGFAFWKGEQLHLLHASSVAKRVIEDPQSLYEYSKNKKAHTGVRAIRVLF